MIPEISVLCIATLPSIHSLKQICFYITKKVLIVKFMSYTIVWSFDTDKYYEIQTS